MDGKEDLDAREELVDHLLLGSYSVLDPVIPAVLDVLRSRCAPLYWHKHGTFAEHLIGVANILLLWKQPSRVVRCGLIHSAYANSYVNLSLFAADQERGEIKSLVGEEAELLTYKFCAVNRQQLIFDICSKWDTIPQEGLDMVDLKKKEMMKKENKKRTEESHLNEGYPCRDDGDDNDGDAGGEEMVHLTFTDITDMIILTMADFAEQFFGWQDSLFGGEFMQGVGNSSILWPGPSQPGLWHHFLSQLGQLVKNSVASPPVYDVCTRTIGKEEERKARDLYWKVVQENFNDTEVAKDAGDTITSILKEVVELNPFIGEPHLLLAQIYNRKEQYELGEEESVRGLSLLIKWGTSWDKRISYGGWVAMARIQRKMARERTYPKLPMEFINMGKL